MAVKKSAKLKKKSSNGKLGASKSAKKMAPAKFPTIKEPLSKSNIIRIITDCTSLQKRDVVAVMDCITQMIEKHVRSGGPGVFVMPGLMKITVVKKPARPARKGINPFTGEEIMIKAKPASRAVKIRALKKLKEMVA